MSILVIGNCQQAPIASILRTSGCAAEAAPRAIHLLETSHLPQLHEQIARADAVVLQYNARPRFQALGLDPDSLRRRHPRVLVVPNLFCAAYAPTFSPAAAELPGLAECLAANQLGPSLDLLALQALETACPIDRLSAYLRRADLAVDTQLATQPLDELRRREAACNLTLSDWIAPRVAQARLFYTLNHPTNAVLATLCERILQALDLAQPVRCRQKPYLSNVRLPVYPAVAATWGVADDPSLPTGGDSDDYDMRIRIDDRLQHLAPTLAWFQQVRAAGHDQALDYHRAKPAYRWAGQLVDRALHA